MAEYALPDDTVQMDLDFFFPDEAQEDVYVREREQITEPAYAAAQWKKCSATRAFAFSRGTSAIRKIHRRRTANA